VIHPVFCVLDLEIFEITQISNQAFLTTRVYPIRALFDQFWEEVRLPDLNDLWFDKIDHHVMDFEKVLYDSGS